MSSYGVPRLTVWLRSQGHVVNRKRVARLMTKMGLAAIYPKPKPTGIDKPFEDLSLSTEGIKHHQTEPSLGNRYYLYSLEQWVCLSGRSYGLVFPVCVVLGTFKLTRCILLSIGA